MKKISLGTAFAILIVFVPLIALAQNCPSSTNGFVPLACAQSSPLLQQAYASPNLATYFNALFKIAISVGAILAVVQIVRAGYLYMLKDSFSLKQDAKTIFSNAIIGLLILLSIWVILNQINPCLLDLNILQDFGSGGTTSSCYQAQGLNLQIAGGP